MFVFSDRFNYTLTDTNTDMFIRTTKRKNRQRAKQSQLN